FPAVQRSLAAASHDVFRIVHFSVQRDHVHLVVEAESTASLSSGMQGLGIRVAKAVNRVLRSHGAVWADRYHSQSLPTPREVCHAIAYVLLNGRKHGVIGHGIDPWSAGLWFQGWRKVAPPIGTAPVRRARTWLLSVGWRRAGSIGFDDAPRIHVRR